MMFFVMHFSVAFILTESSENENEHNLSTESFINNEISLGMDVDISFLDDDMIMEEILDIEEEMILKRNINQEDNQPHIDQELNLKNPIFTSNDLIIKETQDVTKSENANISESDNISTLSCDMYNNVKNKKHEIIYDDNKFRRDIEEALAKAYIFDSPEQFEYDFIICNNKVFQEHLSNDHVLLENNQNEATIPRIISSNDKLENPSTSLQINSNHENKTTKNPHLPSTKISDNQTKSISSVRHINLDNSRLTTIPDLITYKECLESLSMQKNLIGYIPGTMIKLKSLKKFDLSHNMITRIDYKIKNMKLEWLNLSYNHLTYLICMSIFEMTTLKYLNLQNNLIEFIMRFNSEGLISLSMKNNFIAYIPGDMAKLKFLKILDLSHNRINIIKLKMKNMRLEWLDLSYNYLTYLSCISIFSMTTLKYLNLQNNNIEFIGMFNSEGLISLSMKNNSINYMPESIAELTVLKKLDLSHNKISFIRCEMENMKLEYLDLSYNYLNYRNCKIIFKLITLKYLNLQDNNIAFITRLDSEGLEFLNISNNPITWISDSFYELPNIAQLFMSNLKTKTPIHFRNFLPNLKVLDINNNKFHYTISDNRLLYALNELNLSSCKLNNIAISSEMIFLKKLILFDNNIQTIPVEFIKLSNNIEILDLRENPLKIFRTKGYIGALDILEYYYGKVLLDEYILKDIQKLSFDEMYLINDRKEWICLIKSQKNQINDEFYQNIARIIACTGGEEIRNEANEVITLVKEIRDSGFIDFEKTIEEVIKIIKENQYKNICIKNILNYLNTKFSSKLYKFLDAILSSYKIQCLKSTLNHIYNSDEHLNYWIYHLRDILSFIGIIEVKKNPQIHNDRNIILNCFIDISNSDGLANIVKLELEKDGEMMRIFYIIFCNMQDRLIYSRLKRKKTVKHKSIKYILKKYQIIYGVQ